MNDIADHYLGHGTYTTVPWPKVDGEQVKTCGYIEEALQLPICGWGPKGFYTRTPTALRQTIDQIDWRRVKYTDDHFSVRMGRGEGVMLCDSPNYFVKEKRYMRLFRLCFKDIPIEKWQHEIEIARKGKSQK